MATRSFDGFSVRGGRGFLTGSSGTSKSSIGNKSLFGGIGGPAVTTPSLSLNEGGLTRTNSEFLDASRQTLSDLRANRARFGEGFSEFRAARLQEVENARARTTGNLRSQLGRRGILGASFAQDAITRTELDFAQQADKVSAEIDVQEFQTNLASFEQESQISLANLSRELTELGITTQFISGINSAIVARDRIAADLQIAAFNRSRSSGTRVTTLGGRLTGPGGALGSFQFGSPTNTAGPATFGSSAPSFTTQFGSSFNIASTINPNTGSTGSFSSDFLKKAS